eukprot:6527490-Alexandrium_andersonii.AAC.1
MRRLEACYIRSLRKVLRIMATYGAIKAELKPVSNAEVLKRSGLPSLWSRVRFLQLTYLGHVLRRGPRDPLWNIVFDRFLGCRILGGPRRRGVPRLKWGNMVLGFALHTMTHHPFFQEHYSQSKRDRQALVALAQDKARWGRVAAQAAGTDSTRGVRPLQASREFQAAVWLGEGM